MYDIWSLEMGKNPCKIDRERVVKDIHGEPTENGDMKLNERNAW